MEHQYSFKIIGEDSTMVDAVAGSIQSDAFSVSTTVTASLELIDAASNHDGYVVCLATGFQPIQNGRKGSIIPPHANVSFVTQGSLDSVRLWGFQQGASDVIGWPATKEEMRQRLAATVYADADRFHRALSESVILNFLKSLLKKGVKTLEPVMDATLTSGFYYPDAVSALGHSPLHAEALEQMAAQGVLTRSITNRVRSCDTCGGAQLNYREVCANCSDIDIVKTDTLHHFSCGHVGSIDEFRDGTGLACPKCPTSIRHIGVDYEKLSMHYKCNNCDHLSPSPRVETQCMRCTSINAPQNTLERPIYKYELTDMAAVAVEEGRLGGLKLENVLRSGNLGLYTAQYFEHELQREMNRNKRYKSPYSVALIRLDNLDVVRQHHMEKAHDYINQIFAALSTGLRVLDTTCVWNADTLGVLLSSTPQEGGQLVVQKMQNSVKALEHLASIQKPSITVSLFSDIDDYDTAENALNAAMAELNS